MLNRIGMVAGLAMLFATGLAPDARATALVEITWTATTGAGPGVGTDTILAIKGDQLTAEISITAGSEGVSSYAISLSFDPDLDNELNLVAATEFLPTGFDFNLTAGIFGTVESTSSVGGEALTFEAVTLGSGPASGTFVIGELVFDVPRNLNHDGADLFTGFFNAGIDGMFDNLSDPVLVNFGNATVNGIPEPSTALLLVTGLTLIAANQRR